MTAELLCFAQCCTVAIPSAENLWVNGTFLCLLDKSLSAETGRGSHQQATTCPGMHTSTGRGEPQCPMLLVQPNVVLVA